MSDREWKPGDVAMARKKDGTESPHILNRSGIWCDEYGGRSEVRVLGVRPLVVIDPEDREQVERIIRAYDVAYSTRKGSTRPPRDIEPGIGDLQAALRSLVTPPKPPEPTGLGAVVEAHCVHNGSRQKWMRDHAGNWQPPEGSPDDFGSLLDVKVLHEGWSE